jgi:hypothetical protein
VGALLAIPLLLALASGGTTACTTHQCDGAFQDYFGGHVIDDGDGQLYETSALDEPWLNFPGEQSYLIHYPDFGRPPDWASAYVATDPNANAADKQWVLAAGNLAEISIASSTQTYVLNATCSPYYLRVVVHFPPVEATDAGTDAGTGTDTGADTGTDSGTDGSTEQ